MHLLRFYLETNERFFNWAKYFWKHKIKINLFNLLLKGNTNNRTISLYLYKYSDNDGLRKALKCSKHCLSTQNTFSSKGFLFLFAFGLFWVFLKNMNLNSYLLNKLKSLKVYQCAAQATVRAAHIRTRLMRLFIRGFVLWLALRVTTADCGAFLAGGPLLGITQQLSAAWRGL